MIECRITDAINDARLPLVLSREQALSPSRSRVETVEEFKLRIAAIIHRKPGHIPGPPRPNPLLVRHKKRAKSREAQRR